MDNKEAFSLAKLNLKYSKKRNRIQIIIITLALFLISVSVISTEALIKYIDKYGASSPEFCILYGGSSEEDEMKKIVDMYKNDERVEVAGIGNLFNPIGFYLDSEELFDEKGTWSNLCRYFSVYDKYTDYDKELGLYEVLVTENLVVKNSFMPSIIKNSDDYYIDGKDLIGKTIRLHVERQDQDIDSELVSNVIDGDFEFKVVGTIEPIIVGGYGMEIYMSNETMDALYAQKAGEIKTRTHLYIVAKNIDYANEILAETNLKRLTELDDGYYLFIQMIENIKYIGVIIGATGLLCMIIMSARRIMERKQEFGILKAVGYDNNTIYKIVRYESLITFLKGLIYSIILVTVSIILITIFKVFFIALQFQSIEFLPTFNSVVLLLSAFLLGLIATCVLVVEKVKKVDIIKMLREE